MLATSQLNHKLPDISLKNLNAITIGSKVKATYSPVNAMTGKTYSGINRLILADVFVSAGYRNNVWATYCQAQEIGLNVSKGQKPVKIIYWKEDDNGESKAEYANLYNIEQMDVSSGHHDDTTKLERISECSDALKLISRADVTINHTSLGSCYQRKTDTVFIANNSQFDCSDDYHADWVKQLIHSTKHSKRLNRNYVKYTKSLQEAVACEELVVFIGFRFFCDAVGCEMTNDVKGNIYKNCWEDILTNNPKLFIKVCSDAQKATDYMIDAWIYGKPQFAPEVSSTPIGVTCAL